MTAVARAALYAVMGLAILVAPPCAMYGPPGLWTAWLAGMLAAVLAAGLGLLALQPKNERGGNR